MEYGGLKDESKERNLCEKEKWEVEGTREVENKRVKKVSVKNSKFCLLKLC